MSVERRSPDGVQKVIAIASNLNACVPNTPGQFTVVGVVNQTVQFSLTRLYFRQAIIIATPANVGPVLIGFSSVVGSLEQPISLAPGDSYVLQPVVGEKWNFQDLYLSGASFDQVRVIYS